MAPPLTSEEARQQAEAEGLTLLKADNTTGYFGVYHNRGHPKPYTAQVWCGGKLVHLGSFATAEEAALCIARSPEGREAAGRAAGKAAAPPPAPPLTSEEALQQAQAEGLTLLKADNAAGFFGVSHQPGLTKPYQAKVRRGGKSVSLGSFATAEEAALCVARTPEGRAAVKKAAAAPPPAPPLTREEARQQARAEGLTLLKAENKKGYFGVSLSHPGHPKPYQAHVRRGGKRVSLGYFATAEEAALSFARSPEGRAAAKKAAAPPAPPLTSEEARQQAEAEGLTLLKADNTAGYSGVTHNPQASKPKPYKAQVRRGGNIVYLGNFATAEEAALCVARTPEGQAAAKQAAAPPAPPPAPPLTSEEARQQAEAEGLTLLKADNTTGYFGVYLQSNPGHPKPYLAKVSRGGKKVYLGQFATAEEAALCIARTPEGQAAAKQAAAPPAPPLTSEEVRQQAQAEGLTLVKADNKAGYYGVCLDQRLKTKPYKAKLSRGAGMLLHLGSFATAEEAALRIARSPEGRAAAMKAAAAAPPLTSEEADVVEVEVEAELVEAEEAADVQWAVVEGLEVVEVMAHEAVVDEGGRSEGRPKRRRKA